MYSAIPLVWLRRFASLIRRPSRSRPGSNVLRRVAEVELPLVDELHDDDGHEALRDASDPEAIVGPGGSPPSVATPEATVVRFAVDLDERDHGGDVAGCDQLVGSLLQRWLRLGPGADEQRAREDECCDETARPWYVPSAGAVTGVTAAQLGVYEGRRWPRTSRSTSVCRSCPERHESEDVVAAKAGDHDAYARLVRPVRAHRVPASPSRSPVEARTPRRRCRTAS
jgi:hypothetical protein